jgi:putative glycosyltransferase (TIGR04348 family)
MKIVLVSPAPPRSRKGNGVTARRWARLLRQLGHRVALKQDYRGERCDVLIALHARHSSPAIARYRRAHSRGTVFVALTGTDLYADIHTDSAARRSLEWATRLILLQPLGALELPECLRAKTRVIYQSAEAPQARTPSRAGRFEVCVLGHLRLVKDPFRTALAARLLPPASRVVVLHIGAALSAAMAKEARAEVAGNPRYRWLGDLPRWKALRALARCRLLALTSRMEGGANALSEAIAAGVPVVASHIAGSIGILGADYPGYFPVGDTDALAALLRRAENDTRFYQRLRARCRRLRTLVSPAREKESWRRLLEETVSAKTRAPDPDVF